MHGVKQKPQISTYRIAGLPDGMFSNQKLNHNLGKFLRA
jgi:hypothetical protein